MKVRYRNGKAVGYLYSGEELGISFDKIDDDAVAVVEKLIKHGFEAYIVGGAIRDLMLKRNPKDFDVVTNASPRQVHKVFVNSRIIGKRFRIVHVFYGNKIIEVSTFRSLKEHEVKSDNIFGTIEEDCQRRDFSINSLYYSPSDNSVLDMTDSVKDFKSKTIRSLIPLNKTFKEDPVRLIRAVKFSVTTGFKIPFRLKRAIKYNSFELSKIGPSRMTEELMKILGCGKSSEVIKMLKNYGLLVYILPCLSVYADFPQLYDSLSVLDKKITDSENVSKSEKLYYLVKPLISKNPDIKNKNEYLKDINRQVRVFLTPNTPANTDIAETVCLLTKTKV